MIVTKTPLRISFFGGGSDIPQFYENDQGVCVSTTINSHIYLAVNRCVANHLKIIYSELEHETDINNIKHDRVREILKHYDMLSNIEIASFSDMPTKGTGLGSSSTFTVGLINAIYNIKYNKRLEPYYLAELASYIEINKCNQPIGKQDQYAASYGGLRLYRYYKATTEVRKLDISYSTKMDLNNKLFCFNTGINRMASTILTNQVENLKNGSIIDYTKNIVTMAEQSIKYLENNKLNDFGALLHDSWVVKRKLSHNVSNDTIDEMYDIGIKAGALGGKILGAGGGGYLLFYVPDNKQNDVLSAMKNYERFHFEFTEQGSTVEMKS